MYFKFSHNGRWRKDAPQMTDERFFRAIPHKDCASDVLYEHKLCQIFRQMKQKAQ